MLSLSTSIDHVCPRCGSKMFLPVSCLDTHDSCCRTTNFQHTLLSERTKEGDRTAPTTSKSLNAQSGSSRVTSKARCHEPQEATNILECRTKVLSFCMPDFSASWQRFRNSFEPMPRRLGPEGRSSTQGPQGDNIGTAKDGRRTQVRYVSICLDMNRAKQSATLYESVKVIYTGWQGHQCGSNMLKSHCKRLLSSVSCQCFVKKNFSFNSL